jgi:hypothetical protein
VSLFRPSRVYASIEPDQIAIVRMADRHTRETQDERIFEADFAGDRPLDAFSLVVAVLHESHWRDTHRHIVLSDRLVRYLVIDRPEGLRSIAELDLAVQTHFEQAYDATAADWTIALHALPFAQRFVACAVPRYLLDAAQATFSAEGVCASIQPFLICEMNRRTAQLPQHCWYAAAARDCVALSQIVAGQCHRIRVLPISSDSDIADLIEQEQLLSDFDTGAAPVLLSGVVEEEVDAAQLTRVDQARWLSKGRDWSSRYRLALSEVWT